MNSQRRICILFRHDFTPPQSKSFARRYASSGQAKPYVLSRTVIDLDAHDSKLVRNFEELVDEYPELDDVDKRKLRMRKQRLASRSWPGKKLEKTHWKTVQRVNSTPSSSIRHTIDAAVTASDLLYYAVKGGAVGPPSKSDRNLSHEHPTRLRRLFRVHGIHSSDSEEAKTSRLAYGFAYNSSGILGQLGFTLGREAILKTIHDCTSWTKLRVLVSNISSTQEGCAFLAENGETLVNGIRNCRSSIRNNPNKPQSLPYNQVLQFLNNLNLKLGSRGCPIGAHLCNAGLYYAAKAGTLPAVEMYLKISQDASYNSTSHTEQALFQLASLLLRNNLSGSRDTTFPRPHSDAISLLLTGWSRDDGPSSGRERKFCFADLLSHERGATFSDKQLGASQTSLHIPYLLVLGELGYRQTLLHDWKRLGNPRIPNLYPRLPAETGTLSGQHISAIAFLLAKDQSRALSILGTIPRTSEDLKIIKPSMTDRAIARKIFSSHYFFHGLKENHDIAYRIQKEPIPSDPEQALNTIDRYIVDGYFGDASRKEIVTWGTVDGTEGLLVLNGDEQKYFKPAHPTISAEL